MAGSRAEEAVSFSIYTLQSGTCPVETGRETELLERLG